MSGKQIVNSTHPPLSTAQSQAVRDKFCEEVRGEIKSAKEDAAEAKQRVKMLGSGHQHKLLDRIRGDTSLTKRIEYDLFYIQNWSLWLDFKIVLLTVWKGFVHENAH